MALLEKIFVTRYRKQNNDNPNSQSRSCEGAIQQVRLLLYKECDKKGRTVLFDSLTIEKLSANKNDKPESGKLPCILEVSEGHAYWYKGPANDAGVLGEMIFGAVAINCKNLSLKIHIMDEPKRLMCTKIFCVPSVRRINGDTDVNGNLSDVRNSSTPLNVPQKEGMSLSFSIDRGDSGFYGDQSSYSTIGSNIDFYPLMENWDGNTRGYSFSSSSILSSSDSLRRRTSQSLATRFDLSTSLRVPAISTVSNDSQVYSNSSSSVTNDSFASCPPTRRRKLGLALLISVSENADTDVVRRCVEHSNQLQSLVCRLRLATIKAGSGNKFVSTLCKATEDAARWLSDLMYGVRLQPLWLNLVTNEPRQSNMIAEKIISDLCWVIAFGDTKHTNFFITTLVTHVLTHHLGWVTTVSPYDAVEPTNLPKDESNRPYNALWAQLSDLCGSIGVPPRAARTIVTGSTNITFINRLLSVLTYFVRCGEVTRTDFVYEDCTQSHSKVTLVDSRKFETEVSKVHVKGSDSENLAVNASSDSRTGTDGLRKSTTLTNLSQKLSNPESSTKSEAAQLRRNPSIMISLGGSSDSSEKSSLTEEGELEKKVVFVLGDDEKLVGLKNKSVDGKSVKRSSKVHNEPVKLEPQDNSICDKSCEKIADNSSKCCSQTLEHSKPIKHSGFKFEFDKYPQIVTNYMKSKNLEILDRHYIGKPGNLKLDNFQFDPTIIPPIQEERCETCYKCQMMESLLQTPTNASEMEYMNDMPRNEPQYAKETVAQESQRELSPKTFVRKRKENTVIINVKENKDIKETRQNTNECTESKLQTLTSVKAKTNRGKKERVNVRQVIEFPLPVIRSMSKLVEAGFDISLLGGVTDHYVPDLILQGTLANPKEWEAELRRDLDLTLYLNKSLNSPMQAVAIVADINNWEVRILGRDCGSGGLSPLVGGMLDAIPAMRTAKVPAHQCLLYLESKLRELCVLSKTLADMLTSTDFCDINTLTRSLNIDVNDVPLLLAVASTHTPQVATRYGITYR